MHVFALSFSLLLMQRDVDCYLFYLSKVQLLFIKPNYCE
jgi:hypothetical protein